MRMRDRARQGFGGDYKMLRNKCVKLVRRDRMQTAMKKMSEASNRQAAAWRLADSMLKRGNTEKLPSLMGCKSDAECAAACNEFFLQKVEKLVSGVKTSSANGETMSSARDFIKSISKGRGVGLQAQLRRDCNHQSMGSHESHWRGRPAMLVLEGIL